MTELAKAGLDVAADARRGPGVLQLAAAASARRGRGGPVRRDRAERLSACRATRQPTSPTFSPEPRSPPRATFGTSPMPSSRSSPSPTRCGLSFEGTTGVLTELAKAGLKGADGGTSLRTMACCGSPRRPSRRREYQKALGIEIDKTRSIGAQLPQLARPVQGGARGADPGAAAAGARPDFRSGRDPGQCRSRSRAAQPRTTSITTRSRRPVQAKRLAARMRRVCRAPINGLKSNLDTLGITLGAFVKGPLTDFVYGVVAADRVGDDGGRCARLDQVGPVWLGGSRWRHREGRTAKTLFLSAGMLLAVHAERENAHQSLGSVSLRALRRSRRRSFRRPLQELVSDGRAGRRPGRRSRPWSGTRGKDQAAPASTNAPNDSEAPDRQYRAQLRGRPTGRGHGRQEDRGVLQRAAQAREAGHRTLRRHPRRSAGPGAQRDPVGARSDGSERQGRSDRRPRRRMTRRRLTRRRPPLTRPRPPRTCSASRGHRFDLAIQRAVPVPTARRRSVRPIRQRSSSWRGRSRILRKLKHLTIAQQQEIVDLTSAVVGYRSALKGLSNASGSGGGLTAEGLFGEAISSFRSFGSNIGTGFSGILSPQDVRGQLAGQLIKNAPADKLAAVMAQFGQTSTTIASAAARGAAGAPIVCSGSFGGQRWHG